jgi:hypothetical protein
LPGICQARRLASWRKAQKFAIDPQKPHWLPATAQFGLQKPAKDKLRQTNALFARKPNRNSNKWQTTSLDPAKQESPAQINPGIPPQAIAIGKALRLHRAPLL